MFQLRDEGLNLKLSITVTLETQSKVSETLGNANRSGSHGGNHQITVGRQN
jgi:hypothetical protein